MGIVRSLIIGAAVSYGIKKLTEPRTDGSTLLEDIKNNPNDYIQKAKDFVTGKVKSQTEPKREPFTL